MSDTYNILHLCVIVNPQKKGGEIVENATFTRFGKEIKKRLVDMNQKQSWLINQVATKTGLYFDRSYMYKIMTGQLNTPKIVQAICEILSISADFLS